MLRMKNAELEWFESIDENRLDLEDDDDLKRMKKRESRLLRTEIWRIGSKWMNLELDRLQLDLQCPGD